MSEIKRLEIVITRKQYEELKEVAKSEYKTVPSVIREMIDKRINAFKK